MALRNHDGFQVARCGYWGCVAQRLGAAELFGGFLEGLRGPLGVPGDSRGLQAGSLGVLWEHFADTMLLDSKRFG